MKGEVQNRGIFQRKACEGQGALVSTDEETVDAQLSQEFLLFSVIKEKEN